MIIRAGYSIAFQCSASTTMLLMLKVHPSREADLLAPDTIRANPNASMESYIDTFGNQVTRIAAPAGQITFSSDFAIRDSGLPDEVPEDLPLTPVKELPSDALVFLMPSRYCDSDVLSAFAWSQFAGHRRRGAAGPGDLRFRPRTDPFQLPAARVRFALPPMRSTRA